MSSNIRFQPRPTRKLSEVVESDLLTAQEAFIKKEIGGFYSIGDEKAYFRLPGEKASMTVDEFEHKLKTEVHPQFFVLYNPTKTAAHMIEGHHMGFYVPEFGGFVPLCRVGISGSNIISANSQGSVKTYIGKTSLKEKEKAVISRGWVAAFEFAKQFLFDVRTTGGIKRSRVVKSEEFLVFKSMANNLGGKEYITKVFSQAKQMANAELDRLVLERRQEAEAKMKAAAEYVDALPVELPSIPPDIQKEIPATEEV